MLLLDSERAFVSSNVISAGPAVKIWMSSKADLLNGQESQRTRMHRIVDTESLGTNWHQLTEAFVQILLAALSSHNCFNTFKKIPL